MYRAVLTRLDEGPEQCLGHFSLFKGLDLVFSCVTLELPWEDNQNSISCIRKGTYNVLPRHSNKYNQHYILEYVRDREYILIHHGNFNTDTRGCILLGLGFREINGDSLLDITASRRACAKLLEATNGEGFKLTIV